MFTAEDAEQFRNARPFPHIVKDGLWDTGRLFEIAAEFPPPEDPRWTTYPDPKEYGKRCGGPDLWGPKTIGWFDEMFDPIKMAMHLEALTGISPLIPDIIGGGMHMTGEGGRLATHVDFNLHPSDPSFERRLNFLVFLNKDWDDANGGVLYLGKDHEVAVSPQFNRTVIFECSDHSWHGHPDAIVGWNLRKSLACYFYAPRRAETRTPHSTVWGE
jgi:hypothetical protein